MSYLFIESHLVSEVNEFFGMHVNTTVTIIL